MAIITRHSNSRRRRSHLDDPDGTVLIPPEPYLNAVRATLGAIDLDPCSTAKAQTFVNAIGWYRAEEAEAALNESWTGRVFLHPHPDAVIARYQIRKLIRDYLADRVTQAVLLANRFDWLRQEPLLLSLPFALHYKRLAYNRYITDSGAIQRVNPSSPSLTVYFPAKTGGTHISDDALDAFIANFSTYGRVILAEDLGDDWEPHAAKAAARCSLQPLLTKPRVDRYGEPL